MSPEWYKYKLVIIAYSRSGSVWISISSSSIVNIVSSVNHPHSRWSDSNLYCFSSDVLPVPSSPSVYVLVPTDSPHMTIVTHVQLKHQQMNFISYPTCISLQQNMIFRYFRLQFCILFDCFHQTYVSKSAWHALPSVSTQVLVDLMVSVDSPHLGSDRDVHQISGYSCPASSCSKCLNNVKSSCFIASKETSVYWSI